MVPATTPTRAAGTDVPLPGATVTVVDITAGHPGTQVGVITTDAAGGYRFESAQPGHLYEILITKVVTSGGHTVTLSLGAIVKTPATGAAPRVDVDASTTVGLNYVVSKLIAGTLPPGTDISHVFVSIKDSYNTSREDGSAPPLDLTKPCTEPDSYADLQKQVVKALATSGAFLHSDSHSSANSLVNLVFDHKASTVNLALCVLDHSRDFFDADYFSGSVDDEGHFEGKTADSLYVVGGNIAGPSAFGFWRAADGTAKGTWQAQIPAAPTTYLGHGYIGTFTKVGRSTPEGKWFFFVDPDGTSLALVHDESQADRGHLQKTAVVKGTVSASGAITGGLVFPAVAGSIAGGDPLGGGTATGGGTGSTGSHSASGTGSVSGSTTSSTASGLWQFAGLRDGNPFNANGAWSGAGF